MSQRSQAVWRVLAFFYAITVGAFVTSIVSLVAMIWGLIDVAWQLVTNRNDLSEDSKPATVVKGTLRWQLGLFVFAFTGGKPKRLEWTPSF